MRTKDQAQNPRQAKRRPRGKAQAAPVGKRTAGETAAQRRAREAREVAAWIAAHPVACAKPRSPAPIPVVLTQSEKDKRAVFEALGHDADGTCPAGVDWRNFTGGPGSPILKMPRELQSANWAALERKVSRLNHLGAAESATFPPCGWWFCEQQVRLKAEQWADLRAALDILRAAGVDPSGMAVSNRVGTYSEMVARAGQWGKYKALCDAVEEHKLVADALKGTPAIHLLRAAELAKWAKHPKRGAGPPVDAPYHRLLNSSAKWTPEVTAAALVLFGLNRSPRLKAEIRRAEAARERSDELNASEK